MLSLIIPRHKVVGKTEQLIYRSHLFNVPLNIEDNKLGVFLFQVVHSDGQTNGASGVNLDICRGGKEDPTTFFRDGVRKIDFVLVHR